MILPYLELPIYIGYGENEPKVINLKVQPISITSYHEGYNDAGMFIYVDGQPFQVALTIAEYETKITKYFDLITTKQSIKQKLNIIN